MKKKISVQEIEEAGGFVVGDTDGSYITPTSPTTVVIWEGGEEVTL